MTKAPHPLPPHRYHEQGYTLIELAIVACIVSVLIAGGLSTFQRFNNAERVKATNAAMDKIEKALVDYFNANRFLPCPAVPVGINGATLNATAYNTTTATCAQPEGVVPAFALGLKAEDALDGWGNYLTYALSDGMGDAQHFIDPNLNGTEIEVLDGAGNALSTTVNATGQNLGVSYVLLSHGRNALGAYSRSNGARIATTGAGPDELENADTFDRTYVSRETSIASGDSFDDIVRYGSRPMFGEGAMIKDPYYRVRYAYSSYQNAVNYRTTAPTSIAAAVRSGTDIAAYWLVRLWEDGQLATGRDTLFRCVDNLLYMNNGGVYLTGTNLTTYGASTGANYQEVPAIGNADCRCPGPGTLAQHFNVSDTSRIFGACY